jgi:hypothetical protein
MAARGRGHATAPPDILLRDYKLPDGTGLDVLE